MPKRKYLLFSIDEKQKFPRVRFASWTFVVVAGAVLAVLAVVDSGRLAAPEPAADNSTGCQLAVTADRVNIRSGPSEQTDIDGSLDRGDLVDAHRVVTDGFRELEGAGWVDQRFLTPVAGADCG